MLYTSANLIDKRTIEYSGFPITSNDLFEWFCSCTYLVRNEELNIFNSDINPVDNHYREQMLSISKCLRFEVYDLDVRHNHGDLSNTLMVYFFGSEEHGIMGIQFSPWHCKPHVRIALAIAHYFDAIIYMGSEGIVDENYLKNGDECSA